MGYLAYLPFQDYSCQVLIRVIRVKNVISFQGYSEQIPLISFLKEHRKEGQACRGFWHQRSKALCLGGRAFKPLPRTPSISAGLAQRAEAAALQLSSLVSSLKLFQSASANKPTRLLPHLLPCYYHWVATMTVLSLAKGRAVNLTGYMLGTTLMPTPTPLINCSWAHLCGFLCASSLVWSDLLVPLLLLSLQSQIKVISSRKKPTFMPLWFQSTLDTPLLRHTKNTVVSLTLMLDCEVFQSRDWVLI